MLWWLQVLFTITYNYQENQKYSVLPYIAGFIIPTWRFHWFNKWVQSISLIHQLNFTDSQWKAYSCCHQWIVTSNQWPFTDSVSESKLHKKYNDFFTRFWKKNFFLDFLEFQSNVVNYLYALDVRLNIEQFLDFMNSN